MLSKRAIGVCRRSACIGSLNNFTKPENGMISIYKMLSTSASAAGAGASYKQIIGEEPLKYLTFGNILEEAANRWPDRKAIIAIEENTSITFSELLQEADKLAAGFIDIGLKRGDRVGLWAPNISKWPIIKLAACRAGLKLVTINPAYQVSEVEYCLNKVGVTSLICLDNYKTQQYYTMMKEIIPDLGKDGTKFINSERVPSLKNIVMISNQYYPGTYNYNDVLTCANATSVNQISQIQNLIQPDDGCNIQFSSGTTGQPKAAELTHMGMINNGYAMGKRLGAHLNEDKICVQVPFFHVFGVVAGLSASLQHGATLVLPTIGYNPKMALKSIKTEKCTILYGTPTMYVDLLNARRQTNEDLKTKPRVALCGGAPGSQQLFRNITEELNVQSVKSIYGMTEGTASSFFSLIDDKNDVVENSVGYLQDHLEAKVIDEQGRTVPFGQPGELCIRGYSLMLGYWEDPKKTYEIIKEDRWLKTGDQFVLQENGYGKLVGRIKDLIIKGGENVYPAEIENFLNSHPDVLESQVLGVSDERMGEEICAVVRLREGATFTEVDLKKYCTGKIAHYKIPKVLKIIDVFPKTASGKIQKFKIMKMIEENK